MTTVRVLLSERPPPTTAIWFLILTASLNLISQDRPVWAQRPVLRPAQPASAAEDAATDDAGTGDPDDPEDILKLADESLESLSGRAVVVPSMDIEVTSVAKQESTVGRSAAAIFVLTSEMIRRSGANGIADLLRMVPGLEVARIDASSWAIASRGFNAFFTNKLLVLIDGRSVYNPSFSGVNWDVQDLLLEDLERIEVIRGPGGTLWGANAVNGVINIITKKAHDTQGLLVTSGGGSEDRTLNGIRYGGHNGPGLSWRIYGKHFERDGGFDPDRPDADDWRMGRGGFRMDWELDPWKCNTLTVQGDYYGGEVGHTRSPPIPDPPFTNIFSNDSSLAGANVLARLTHTFDEESDWALQAYYDQYFRGASIVREELSIFDVDFQHRFPLGNYHHIIWGIGYRQVGDDLASDGFVVSFTPQKRTTDLFSAFVQDEITLVDDRLCLTVGSKFEENDFSGFEYQPCARLLWTPDRRHSGWAAISRAVRTPSRFDHNGTYTLPLQTLPFPFFPRLIGNTDFRSEQLVAYEIGCRAQASKRFAWDVATFINVYENLENVRMGAPFLELPNLIVPLVIGNGMRGQTYGVEAAGQWTVSESWRLSASYSFLQMQLHSAAGFQSDFETQFEGSSPHNQVRCYSAWDLPRGWEFDLGLRYVDNLPALQTDDYITMDLRLACTPSENLEVAVVGQNLLDSRHLEFRNDIGGTYILGTQVQRSVFAKATWRY